jgi:hypothetical protein
LFRISLAGLKNERLKLVFEKKNDELLASFRELMKSTAEYRERWAEMNN